MFASNRGPQRPDKVDKILNERAGKIGTSRVIVIFKPGKDASSIDVKRLGGKLGRRLGLINGHAIELPNAVIRNLADNSANLDASS